MRLFSQDKTFCAPAECLHSLFFFECAPPEDLRHLRRGECRYKMPRRARVILMRAISPDAAAHTMPYIFERHAA